MAIRVVAVKAGLRKSARSSIGLALRRSTRTKAMSADRAERQGRDHPGLR